MKALKKHMGFILVLLVIVGFEQSTNAQPLPLSFAECQDFFESVVEGDLASIKDCLNKNPELLNKKDGNGKTPLMYAAESGNPKLVSLLLKKGAYIEDKHDDGRCALHFAAMSPNSKTLKLLVAEGANINCQDFNGKTALHIAVEYERLAHIDFLLSQHANTSLLDFTGRTAFDQKPIEL